MVAKTQQNINQNEFSHVVLTRFNVAIGYASAERGIESPWLEERLALFEQYCLPSVSSNRQRTEFEWLVFCNAASPAWFKEKMASLNRFFTAVYIEGICTDDVIAQKVTESGHITKPYLITTRIDNDDSISGEHLFRVQNAFRQQRREFVVFPFGLQLYRGHLYQVIWPDNPFLSLIEKVPEGGRITTVFCVPHTNVYSAGRVQKQWCRPQWMQVIHGNNVGNSLRGWPMIRSRNHPGFDVRWPESADADSLLGRAGFTWSYLWNRGRRMSARLMRRATGTASQQP
jgi:hypothetical protein